MTDMTDTRKKNVNWKLATNSDGTTPHGDAQLAVIMDLRDELQTLVRAINRIAAVITCPNTAHIPAILRGIRRAVQRKRSRPTPRSKEAR